MNLTLASVADSYAGLLALKVFICSSVCTIEAGLARYLSPDKSFFEQTLSYQPRDMNNEKNVQYGEEPRPSDARKGSIYQVISPQERRMSAQGRRISVVDDIFGEIKEGGPNYRNVQIPRIAGQFLEGLTSFRSDGLGLLC